MLTQHGPAVVAATIGCHALIDEARTAGASWAAVGEHLGLSRQAVQKRYGPEPEASKPRRPDVFSRMTPGALFVITHARSEAQSRQSDVIGVEHLLLGLVAEPESTGARALAHCGAPPATITAAINGRIGLPSGKPRTDEPPFTPHAKAVLERSRREALRLHSNDIGTDHLVLACLAGPGGLVLDLLHNLGVTYDSLRETIDPRGN